MLSQEATVQEKALTYGSYLKISELLSLNQPLTREHDEVLFITIHQVYELWFAQILHELGALQARLEAGETAAALSTLKRVLTIMKIAVAQLDVLETMTPTEFSSFRARLDSASGFQSAQFREVEAVLGRRDTSAMSHHPEGDQRSRIEAAMARPDLYDSLCRYLAKRGIPVPEEALDRDPTQPRSPSPSLQQVLLAVYREDPEAASVCERFVDLDEGMQEWRYRHVKMVERTIGAKPGTGGSPGAEYLRQTLFQPSFPDLWEIRAQL